MAITISDLNSAINDIELDNMLSKAKEEYESNMVNASSFEEQKRLSTQWSEMITGYVKKSAALDFLRLSSKS